MLDLRKESLESFSIYSKTALERWILILSWSENLFISFTNGLVRFKVLKGFPFELMYRLFQFTFQIIKRYGFNISIIFYIFHRFDGIFIRYFHLKR